MLYYQDDVVRITQAGKLIAAGVGTTVLTGVDKNGKSLKISVNVSEPVTKVIYLNKGSKTTLKHYGVTNKKAAWKLSIGNGISVNAKGIVQAIGYGKNVVSCSYNPYDAGGFKFKTIVYVESPYLVSDLKLVGKGKATSGKYTLELTQGESYRIKHEKLYQLPVYKSSKGKVAYADEDGIIHAVSPGSSNISAKINGKNITITVKVKNGTE